MCVKFACSKKWEKERERERERETEREREREPGNEASLHNMVTMYIGKGSIGN